MKKLVCALIVGGSLVATGCGQKGALYLPDKNASVVTRPGDTNAATPAQPAPSTTTPPPPAPNNMPSPQQPPQGAAPQPSPNSPGTTTPPNRPKDKEKNDDSDSAPKNPK